MDIVNKAVERIGGGAAGRGGVGFTEAVEVDNCGVNVPQVDDFGLLVTILMEDCVGTDEEENPYAHDERTQDLQPVRVQIPAKTSNNKHPAVTTKSTPQSSPSSL